MATLQELYDAMKAKKLSTPSKYDYIKVDGYAVADKFLDGRIDSESTKPYACAIGEACLQISQIANECFVEFAKAVRRRANVSSRSLGTTTAYERLVQLLEQCVPETAVSRDLPKDFATPTLTTVFKNLGTAEGTFNYRFWGRVEEYYSYTTKVNYSRLRAIAKAAKDFGIPLKTK